MASTVLNASQELRMTDSSLETSYDKSSTLTDTNTTVSDDEDDELLALRIAALESIKLQKAKPPTAKSPSRSPGSEKPDFVIKSHPKRSNLLSIVTCQDEQDGAGGPPALRVSPPPAPLPYFDPTRPPPGFGQKRFSRSPFSRRSRSPMYRRFVSRSRSRSPGRRPWSRSPPPHYRRRSISPYRRRRSFSRSPPRRSPPRRRSQSPTVGRKSRSPTPPITPSESEWETDTESEEEEAESDQKEEGSGATEDKQKDQDKQKATTDAENADKKPVNKSISQDDDAEDILKLDATAEEDEFSAFLNEFEDEVLSKKEPAKDPKKKEKKERIPTEKKVVDGKKLRKKIKPKKETRPPTEIKTQTQSPRLTRSPGRRYFSPNRNREGKFSPRRKEDRGSQEIPRKSRERNTKSREKTVKDTKPVESAADREQRERKEYEDKMSRLPTPEREMMEARRKKFEKKIDVSKKISLKSEKTEDPDLRLDIKRRIGGAKDNERQQEADAESPPRKRVTDLRVQLHKKRKAQDGDSERGAKKSVQREASLSPDRTDPDEEAFGPVERSGRRRVVAPGVKVKAKLKHSEDESDRSPSPLAKLQTRKIKTSGANIELQDSGLKGRRILVVRKERNSSPEQENITITQTSPVSPKKGVKKPLHLRLGGKVDGYSESDMYVEMLKAQEEKKLAKKLKKEKKALKKEKKAKKSKKQKWRDSDAEKSEEEPLDSDEELFRFFEEPEPPTKEVKKSSKRRSGDRDRNSSGEKTSNKKRIVRAKKYSESEELDIGKRLKSKRRSSNEGSLDGESADILEKMRKKNEKRLKRAREIEQDKLMFS